MTPKIHRIKLFSWKKNWLINCARKTPSNAKPARPVSWRSMISITPKTDCAAVMKTSATCVSLDVIPDSAPPPAM